VAFFLALSSQALAQDSSSSVDDNDLTISSPVSLGEIDIRGIVRREELKSTSATILDNKAVSDRIFYQPLDMVYMSPGVSILQYGEAGMSPQFQMRGFSARNDMAMYLDGIPLHDNGHAAGFTDSTVVLPIEIESVEIIKGPASVYYGARSAGGTVAVQSIKSGNFNRLNLRYGSWNDVDVSGLIAHEGEKLAQVYAFEFFRSDGYRDNSDWNRRVLSTRWTYKFTDKFQTSLNLRAYNAEWDSAGYVSHKLNTKRGWVNDGTGHDNGNGGKRDRYDARLWANYLLNDNSQLTYYLYGTTMRFTRYQRGDRTVSYLLAADATFPNRSCGFNKPLCPTMTEQYNQHNQWGTGLTYNYNGQIAGKDATFTAGVTYSKDMDDPRATWTIPWGYGRERVSGPASKTSFSIENPAILSEFSYQILPPLNVRLGARYDWIKGKFTDELTKVTGSSNYTFFSPKAGVVYSPLDNLDIYANFGRGFSMPTSFNTSQQSGGFFAKGFKLARRDQYEFGFKYYPLTWLGLETTLYRLKTYNDFYTDPITSYNVQAGQSTREGIEFSAQAVPAKDWRIMGNFAYMEAKYDKHESGGADFHGYRLPWVPRTITNLEVAYEPELGFGGRLTFRYEADMLYEDNPRKLKNGNPNLSSGVQKKPWKAPDKGMLDIQLSYKFNDTFKLLFDAKNIVGKAYEGYAYGMEWNTGDYLVNYTNPRAFYLTLQMNWDPKKE
jgi:outer membrane receptor protein involved in Fe transport